MDLISLATNWKTALAGSAFLADAVAEISNYENVGTKALLIGAVIYLVRQRESDRTDAKAREDRLNATISANTDALTALKTEFAQQTIYYRDVVKTIVDKETGSNQ